TQRVDTAGLSAPRKRLLNMIGPFIVILITLALMIGGSLRILSGLRAYIEAESLWSKAQKGAVLHLIEYGITGDQATYQEFLNAIAIPLHYRAGRKAMEMP